MFLAGILWKEGETIVFFIFLVPEGNGDNERRKRYHKSMCATRLRTFIFFYDFVCVQKHDSFAYTDF